MAERPREIGPLEMGQQLMDALGLTGMHGVLKIQIALEAMEMPTVTIVRTITAEQAGNLCLRLREWNCALVPISAPRDQRVRSDGSTVEEPARPFANSLPLQE